VKTVFNYFSSKEELFFDRADEARETMVDAVRQRDEGVSALEALRGALAGRRVPFDRDGWRSLRDPDRYEAFRQFLVAASESPTLRARRLAIVEQWAEDFEELFAAELDDAREARVLAAMVAALVALRERELSDAMLERASPRAVERRVRAVVDEGIARLQRAFPGL
jgi:AcrR family transcriptional regulator